jgi:HEAT repeat protein
VKEHPGAAVSAFIKLLQDEERCLRYVGAWWLGLIGPAAQAAIPHLQHAAEDHDEFLRREAARALVKIGS